MHYINSPELFHESVSLCSNTCIGEFYKLFIIALKNVCFLEEAHYNYENGQLGYFYKKLSLWVCGKHPRDSLPQLQTHGKIFRSLLLEILSVSGSRTLESPRWKVWIWTETVTSLCAGGFICCPSSHLSSFPYTRRLTSPSSQVPLTLQPLQKQNSGLSKAPFHLHSTTLKKQMYRKSPTGPLKLTLKLPNCIAGGCFGRASKVIFSVYLIYPLLPLHISSHPSAIKTYSQEGLCYQSFTLWDWFQCQCFLFSRDDRFSTTFLSLGINSLERREAREARPFLLSLK